MDIVVINRQRTQKINLRLLKKIIASLLTELNLERVEIGISLVAAPEMTRLNETFLRHAGSTDVIAFDYLNNVGQAPRLPKEPLKRKMDRPDACPALHGEIFVCVDEAMVQARKFGITWQSETVRYIVHGILHLTGYDDRRPAARRKMKREENRRLGELSRRFSLAQLSRPAKIAT
jgi:probable rRNA maturation factor